MNHWSRLILVVYTYSLAEYRELLYAFHGYVNRPHDWIMRYTYVLDEATNPFSSN